MSKNTFLGRNFPRCCQVQVSAKNEANITSSSSTTRTCSTQEMKRGLFWPFPVLLLSILTKTYYGYIVYMYFSLLPMFNNNSVAGNFSKHSTTLLWLKQMASYHLSLLSQLAEFHSQRRFWEFSLLLQSCSSKRVRVQCCYLLSPLS